MSKLDKMKDLRGGVIYAAARVAPTTARTWALDLGVRRSGGHPRYDISDVVALVIMRHLTENVSMAAGTAVQIVRALQPTLPALIERVVAEQETTNRYRRDGGPFAIFRSKPNPHSPTSAWLVVIEDDKDFADYLLSEKSGLSPVVIPLVRPINYALHNVARVDAGELGEEAALS